MRTTRSRPQTAARGTVVSVTAVSLSPIARKAQRAERNAQQQRFKELAESRLTAKPGMNGTSPSSSSTPAPIRPSDGAASTSYDILEAFFYGRAFAMTLSKRLGEVVVDTVAEISKAAAERPQRIQEFQDEVAQLARKEMTAASLPERAPNAVSSSSSGNALKGTGSGATAQDVEALVDDLRAEIAYTRAVLQLIKTNGKSGAVPGPAPSWGADGAGGQL